MDIIDSIVMLMNTIGSWFSQFFFQITKFFNGILAVLSYIWSILKSLRYGLVTLVSGTYDMIVDLFNSDLFSVIKQAFDYISGYIGSWATWFIMTVLFIAILRIGFAFLFKHFRLNLDYKKDKFSK